MNVHYTRCKFIRHKNDIMQKERIQTNLEGWGFKAKEIKLKVGREVFLDQMCPCPISPWCQRQKELTGLSLKPCSNQNIHSTWMLTIPDDN